MRILVDESLPRQLVPLLIDHDARMVHQQNMPRVGVEVIVLRAHTNRLEDIAPFVPALLGALSEGRVGTVTHVGV